MENLSSDDVARLVSNIEEIDLATYTVNNIVLDGTPFSFKGHNYLVDMYADDHPYQVIEKSAQMGASVLGMAKSFFVCDKMAKNVIYFFPTDEDVREFSKSRVAPIIRDSAHLKNIVNEVDAVGIRQIGRGFLYFRGMKSSIRMKSVPADMLVFDELDEVTDDQKALADQRLNHSSLRWRYMLSTPTFDNYGIDYEFKRSDQRFWNLICRKCNTRNILEKQFPDCVKQISETKHILVCRSCDSELDRQYGMWIPERKTERIRGYHLCGLFSEFIDLTDLMDEYKSGRRREEFMRSKMGFPWVSADQRVTRDMVESCIGSHDMGADPQYPHSYMGVDQKGDEIHIVIRNRDRITRRPRVLFIGIVREFKDLDRYMREYDVDLCVIDGLPNQHSARDFAKRFAGRVYLCYYNDKQKGAYKWASPEDKDAGIRDWQVLVDRTEALDSMYEEITRRDLILPKLPDEQFRGMFLDQMIGLARVSEEDEDTGIKRAMWKKLGADHFAHANSYSAVAMSRFAGTAQGVTIKSKVLGMNIVSRRYEQGSPY